VSGWIITGMSGAGKATALAGLEREGVTCVDNLPVSLMQPFFENTAGIAVAVIDARQGEAISALDGSVSQAQTLFLDARDDVLVRRLGESTRPHPFESSGRGQRSVAAERALLSSLRERADVVVDTSELTPAVLQERVRGIVLGDSPAPSTISITLSSFGYKHGPELEADWVVDSRMMRNPFWVPELRPLTGLDAPVRDFVLQQPEAGELVRRLEDTLCWAAPRYAEHKRRYLHVAIGCTGGRHRSVVISEELASRLRHEGFAVTVHHRDVHRPDPRG
jgi:UPF0042 nucleotide-binding protein